MGQAYLFGNENRASESLRGSVVTKLLQDFYVMPVKTTTALLSRDYKDSYSTLIKRLQDFYQETTALLSRLLQHHYSTPIKGEAKALQHYRTHISKMIEYLNFIL